MKKLVSFALIVLLTSCLSKHDPLSPSLTTVVDSFINKHPSWDVIKIIASKPAEHDLLDIIGQPTYDPNMIDGYCIYKNRLLTYYQTDSLDRSSLIDTTHLLRYNGQIENYKNMYLFSFNCEPHTEVYEIKDKDKLSLIKNPSDLKYNRKHTTASNVVKNKELNEFINTYIYYNIDMLYELRFCIKDSKQYVMFRSMPFYDKEKYDGYFYRNGYLIVLYGADHSGELLDSTWIKKEKIGIPSVRYTSINETLWNFPFPEKIEILPDGHLKRLSIEEGFFIRDNNSYSQK